MISACRERGVKQGHGGPATIKFTMYLPPPLCYALPRNSAYSPSDTMKHQLRIILVVVLLWPTVLFAGELKIVDSRGLTRLLKVIAAPVTVIVSPESSSNVTGLRLLNVDGIARDIKATQLDQRHYLFSGVGEGTWQIKSTEAVVIQSVEIGH